MEKKSIYQSRGVSKKMILKMRVAICLLFICAFITFIMCIQKRSFAVGIDSSAVKDAVGNIVVGGAIMKSKYEIVKGPILVMPLFCVLLGLIVIEATRTLRKTEVDLYDGYMEFTKFFIAEALGFNKNMKKIRILYKDIIDVKGDLPVSRIIITTKTEKQYVIFCQNPEKLKEIISVRV